VSVVHRLKGKKKKGEGGYQGKKKNKKCANLETKPKTNLNALEN